jgi:aminoacyl-tRNA hydrolase
MIRSVLRRAVRGVKAGLGTKLDSRRRRSKWLDPAELGYGAYKKVIQPAYERMYWMAARVHRTQLEATVFIGVTGSVGKTTTSNLIASVLATTFSGRQAYGTRNNVHSAARSILNHARRGDVFHVVELSAPEPGWLPRQLDLVRPSIGVITAIGTDHFSNWGSIEAIAGEKGRLIRSLPRHGTAILNADDPRVLAMTADFEGRTITYGVSESASVRAVDVSASWPDRLSFRLVHGEESVFVQTRMCGRQWVSAALAAAATGIAMGTPLEAIARGLADVEPVPARMSPVISPDGVAFIRDDLKAPIGSIGPAMEFVRTARARRKIVVIGTISDITHGRESRIYAGVAREALAAADLVCFVGTRAFSGLRAKDGANDGRLLAFGTVRAAHEFLHAFLEAGDLVLLKGSNTADHLFRLILARTSDVACWRMNCQRNGHCDRCDLLGVPSGLQAAASEVRVIGHAQPGFAPVADAPTVVIGLGNPGAHRRNTPHNVGFAMVDRLAAAAGVSWRAEEDADIATLEFAGDRIRLVKPRALINESGAALSRLAGRMPLRPEACVLVYDDLDLQMGVVRMRRRGSDGGHRGVRSILEAFQSDAFPRVKIGVRRRNDSVSAKDTVLRPFAKDEQDVIDVALSEAERQLDDLVKQLGVERKRVGVGAAG